MDADEPRGYLQSMLDPTKTLFTDEWGCLIENYVMSLDSELEALQAGGSSGESRPLNRRFYKWLY